MGPSSPFSNEDENESGQDDELEQELNQALYYTDWDNIPEEISQKYSINISENGTVSISRKLDASEVDLEPVEEFSSEQETQDFKVETRASRLQAGNADYEVVRVEEEKSHESGKAAEQATPSSDLHPKAVAQAAPRNPHPIVVDLEKEEAKYQHKRKISEVLIEEESASALPSEPQNSPPAKKKKNKKKKRKRKLLESANEPSSKKPRSENIPIIQLSDSEDEQEPIYPPSEEDDVILNITQPETYEIPDSDDEHQISGDFDWTQVESPSTWTSSMKRYYNKPSKEMIGFDEKKIISNLRENGLGSRNWFVNNKDLYMPNKRMRRCPICKNADYHPLDRCPKRHVICFMCGEEGHMDKSCPRTLCLNCGKKTYRYSTACEKCMHTRGGCSICQSPVHTEELCSDVWRRFHATVSSDDPAPSKRKNDRVFCCNCARQGHHYEDCPAPYYSKYEPTSSFITNYKGESQLFLSYEVFLPENVTVNHPSYQSLEQNSVKNGLKVTRVQGTVPRVRVEGHLRKIKAFRKKLALLNKQVPPRNKRKNKKRNRRQNMVFV